MKRFRELTFDDFEIGQSVYLAGNEVGEATVVSKGNKYITLDNGIIFNTDLYSASGYKLYLSKEQFQYENLCIEHAYEIERQLHFYGDKRYTMSQVDLLKILMIIDESDNFKDCVPNKKCQTKKIITKVKQKHLVEKGENMKSTKIYSVFPACGKTYLYENQNDLGVSILDSDSSEFSHMPAEGNETHLRNGIVVSQKPITVRLGNPDFPNNYIKHIKANIGKYDYIFVSSHEEVRKALNDNGIDFTIVYPDKSLIAEWVGRCYLREMNGNNGFPIEVLIDNWDKWVLQCEEESKEHNSIVLKAGEYLSNYIEIDRLSET